MSFQSVNPTTDEVLETFQATPPRVLERILDRADRASRDWRRRSVRERGGALSAAATLLRARAAEYARVMAREMGKPIAQGLAEVTKCAWACDYFAQGAEAMLADQPRDTEAAASYVRFEPLGPVLAIMPWNYPFWQVVRFAAPALAAGNVCVLKHAPNVPRCGLALEALFADAGCPEGVFQSVFLEPDAIGALIADPRIRGVTLTGSWRAGASVAEHAGRSGKKAVLELGGSDAFIVLEDADLAAAARAGADARLQNSGQSCIAAKRFIVLDAVADAFLVPFADALRAPRLGDPLAEGTELGPLARRDLRDVLHRQVEESIRRGAELGFGGRLPEGPGAFYPPTLLTAVRPGMPVFDEETFGPVAAVIRARDAGDALRLANASAYGLGASVWTANRSSAEALVAELDVGLAVINGIVKSDPRLPFGGVKASGYGRELSEFGLREFVNVKSVSVA